MTDFARVHGTAMYELAAEEGLSDRLLGELDTVAQVLEGQPEFVRLLSLPSLPKAERRDVVDKVFRGRAHPYTLGLLKLLVDKGAVRSFGGCVEMYRELYNEANGILAVSVTTAVPLEDSARERLVRKLELVFNKRIVLTCAVDPAVLGGVRLEAGGRRYDGTVRDRLDRVQRGLMDTVL